MLLGAVGFKWLIPALSYGNDVAAVQSPIYAEPVGGTPFEHLIELGEPRWTGHRLLFEVAHGDPSRYATPHPHFERLVTTLKSGTV